MSTVSRESAATQPATVRDKEKSLLSELAKRIAEIAALPIQEERRRLWKLHNSLRPDRPMILIFPEGGWTELMPESRLQCESDLGRRVEAALRRRIYHHEHFADDTVIEGDWVVPTVIESTGWGLEPRHRHSTTERGAWAFEPVLKSVDDLEKMRVPKISVNHTVTEESLALANELFDGILNVRQVGVAHISYHLMKQYTDIRGLEEMMVDMFQEPELLHRTMRFFVDAHKSVLKQYQDLNLLSLNNDGTYHSTGGVGYTDELPSEGFDPKRVRPQDMWSSAESQELAQVGPAQHEEFALRYERELLEPFALNGYGCCEPLTDRLEYVFSIPGLRRPSISPWADVDVAAEGLGPHYIFSWKPKPMHLVGGFDADEVRGYLRATLEVAKRHNCVLEMILKDTHTCENRPERFDMWSRIAREEVQRIGS